MGNNGSEGDKNNNYSSVNTDKHNIKHSKEGERRWSRGAAWQASAPRKRTDVASYLNRWKLLNACYMYHNIEVGTN